jgi:WD40 repeat protein
MGWLGPAVESCNWKAREDSCRPREPSAGAGRVGTRAARFRFHRRNYHHLESGSRNGQVEDVNRHGSAVNALTRVSDERVAAGTEDGKIEIWNYNTGNLETSLLARHDWINALVILGNGRVASASDDRTISIWNPSKDGLDARLEGHSGRVNALAVLPVLRKKPYRAVFNPM